MLIIRPAVTGDLGSVVELAKQAGVGVTSLPPIPERLQGRLEQSEKSFRSRIKPEHAYYLFALEDTEKPGAAGVSAIQARVGLDEVWYNYRVSNCVHASSELGIHQQTSTLYLTNDMTDCSEICTLFLSPSARQGGNGHLLSKARMMFMADHLELFSEKLFAEMRGVSDEQGVSPFWESLGRKFFSLDFPQADFLTGAGSKAFIAELMPKYPIYLPFLSEEARASLAQVHAHTRPALALLSDEGFRYNGLVDIFDGGPVVEVFVSDIRCIRESRKFYVVVSNSLKPDPFESGEALLVSNRRFEDYRATLVHRNQIRDDSLLLTPGQATGLQVMAGDVVRATELKAVQAEEAG